MILGSQGKSDRAQAYMEQLCETYWKPCFYYARRRGLNEHDANDCVQEFFTRMLAGDWLDSVDPERGRFRGWIHTALRRWVSRFRQRTGIDRETISDDGTLISLHEPPDDETPDNAFQREWADTVMARALDLMRSEQRKGERPRKVQVFLHYLEQSQNGKPSYQDLAAHFDVTVTTITNDLHRAKVLFKTYLERVVLETIADPAELQKEIHELQSILSQPSQG